jgi:membrane associated rhomboid family serine protease
MKILSTMILGAAAGAAAFSLFSCQGGIGVKYSVGGTLTGLVGSGLVLEDDSGNDLQLASNGGFVCLRRRP